MLKSKAELKATDTFCITVGILSWNRKDAIEVALKSVQKQTMFKQIETIVFDSNSSDGSPEFIENNFPWVKLIKSKENPGLANGRNILVDLANAPIVFWMDDDCELVEDYVLEKMFNFMQIYPKVGVLYANILEGDDDKDFTHFSIPQDLNKKDFGSKCIMTASFASGGTCVRKNLFIECGGYDKEYFRMNVENDLSYRIYNKGFCICYYPEVTIIHRPHKYGRNYSVITYYSLRNKLWGFWRNLPFAWAIVCTMIELPMGFLRAVQKRVVLSWFKAVWHALKALPGRRKLRKPISQKGINLWAFCCHHIVEWKGKIPEVPEYNLREYTIMEIKTRILSRFNLWKRDSEKALFALDN